MPLKVIENQLINVNETSTDIIVETCELFMSPPLAQDLGMLDSKASELEITIQGRDFTIKQNPGALQSNQEGGTTASAVWQSSVRAAEWLAQPSNVLFQAEIVNASSNVLELGSGISALVPCILSPRVGAYLATDQPYVLKLLQKNLDCNATAKLPDSKLQKGRKAAKDLAPKVQVLPLDWETTDAPSLLRSSGLSDGVDVVLSCDSIYNYALVEPFAQTCVEVCGVRNKAEDAARATVCVIVQQLRQPDVFELWLETFMRRFLVWRVPESSLTHGLGEGSGFAVHVAVLKDDSKP